MPLFRKAAIIGTGLIGGSLALFIKKHRLAGEIVGVARHKASLALALRRGAIDRGSISLEIVKGADLVILAAPVDKIIASSRQILKFAGKDCLVTDVGSTKSAVVSRLEKVFKNYVGAHPLAGSEKRGIANANPGIFKGSLCILTSTAKTQNKALAKIKKLWIKAGASIAVLSPEEHDKILAFTSHLPHAAVFSLINSIPVKFLKFAAGGLKDTTRIASSDPKLWQAVFLTNKKSLLQAISDFELNLKKIKSAIRKKDKASLIRILKQARRKRSQLR